MAAPAAWRYWAHYRQGTPASVRELPGWVQPVARWLDEAGGSGATPLLPLVVAPFAGLWRMTGRLLLDHPASPDQRAAWVAQSFTS